MREAGILITPPVLKLYDVFLASSFLKCMQKERKKEIGRQLGKRACSGKRSFTGTYGLHVTVSGQPGKCSFLSMMLSFVLGRIF